MDIDPAVYATTKSPRPRWANLLIISLVMLLAATFAVATSMSIVLVWILLAAAGALAVTAGIVAMLGRRRAKGASRA